MTNNYYRMRSLNRLYSCDAVFCCVFWPHDSALKIKKSAIIPKILLDAVSYLKNFQSLLIISENDEIKVTFGNVIGKFVYGWNLTRYFFNFNFHERNTWSRVQRINRPYFWHSSGPKLGPFLGLEFVSYRFKVWIPNLIKNSNNFIKTLASHCFLARKTSSRSHLMFFLSKRQYILPLELKIW